jgi:hypothetical protein
MSNDLFDVFVEENNDEENTLQATAYIAKEY